MAKSTRHFLITAALAAFLIACKAASGISELPATEVSATNSPEPIQALPTLPALPSIPVQPGGVNPDEPVLIYGDIPYTSRFFVDNLGEPFVLLEDQAGFVNRDLEFQFPPESQAIGPVKIHADQSLTYQLPLPSIPQGTHVDVDNDGEQDSGVQVFAVAFWANTWGDPFLEERDGTGWSTASASTRIDMDREDEIVGGTLVVWSPDNHQAFPVGFGTDGLLFTSDDPTEAIPAGYNLVDLDQTPFRFYKENSPQITLPEGAGAVNDYSDQSYTEAFDSLFQKMSLEYPFTKEKNVDWQALYSQHQPVFEQANDPIEFHQALLDFSRAIPDGHIGLSFNTQLFLDQHGGGLGLLMEEMSDGQVIVTEIVPGLAAERAGIQTGAEIKSWNGEPVSAAIDAVQPFYPASFSTNHTRRIAQLNYLSRLPADTRVEIEFINPNQSNAQTERLRTEEEFDTLSPIFGDSDPIELPIVGETLQDSGLGYIRINTFQADTHLLAQLWEHYIQAMIDNEVPGLIIDLRNNGGGYSNLAQEFAGYFFDREIELYTSMYYNDRTGQFEARETPAMIKPAPLRYDGEIVVLVGPDCASACEGFAYALTQDGRATIIGNYPTAGLFGSVGLGQFELPDDISMQFPTGRPVTPDGKVLIEGVGVIPDILVPLTAEAALSQTDMLLNRAIEELQNRIQ